jgi:hypothetical protein
MPRERRKVNIQDCRIGRSGHTRYWCGFCRKILPVTGRHGQAAWDERFTHIDDQHYKNHEHIDNWLCIVTKVLKGEELEDRKMQVGPAEAEIMEDSNLPDLSSDDEDPMLPPGPPLEESEPDSPLQQAVEPDVDVKDAAPQAGPAMDRNLGGIHCVSGVPSWS